MAAAGVTPRDLPPVFRRGLRVAGDQGRGGAPRKARKLRDLAMSPPGPSPATDVLSAVKAAGSAEEIFALLGVAYDPKRLNIARLHILKRMSAHLDEAELDTLPADVVQSSPAPMRTSPRHRRSTCASSRCCSRQRSLMVRRRRKRRRSFRSRPCGPRSGGRATDCRDGDQPKPSLGRKVQLQRTCSHNGHCAERN